MLSCPKCHHENPEGSTFCGKCASRLPRDKVRPTFTETLENLDSSLTRGTLFAERYEIIEELGSGGMGRVYRAEDKKLKQEVALKLIKPEIAKNKKTADRFQNELKSARMISHKNVCRMFDLGESGDINFISMEYVRGEDLRSMIRMSGQIGIGTAINIAKQICQGLSEAHLLGIIHRDLKSSNIMIDKDGITRIMDFGIARSLKGKGITGEGVLIGTPEYMSPEQIDGKDADQRSDIYAVGVILYEMLTGRVPFDGKTPFSVGVKQKSEPPKEPKYFNDRISDDLNQIILKCLEKKPEDRFQSTDELCSDLSRIEQGLPSTARVTLKPRATTSRQVTVTITPKKLIFPAAAVLIMLVAFMFIWKPWSGALEFQTADSGLPSIGFLKLRNGTGDPDLDHLSATVPDLLIADLDQSRYFRVQSAERINQVLHQMNLDEKTSFTVRELREIARKSGVETLVTGNFTRFGEKFRINISLLDGESGDILSTEKSEGEGEASVFGLVDDLTRKIKSHFNLTEAQFSNDRDKEIGVITTSYPEAYQYYKEGRKFFLKIDYETSNALMKKAIQIDPDFAMAYRSIAMAYANSGYRNKAKEYFEKAMSKSSRLSYKEKKIIEAHYKKYIENDWQGALSIYKGLLADYPEDNFINCIVGVIYSSALDYDNAIRHTEICRKNQYDFMPTYSNLAGQYMAKGEYGKAHEVYKSCEEYFGDSAWIRARKATIYICEGKLEKAQEEAQKAIEMNPRMFSMGFIDHIKGNFSSAEKEYELWLDYNDPIIQIYINLWLAILNATQGKYERASFFLESGLTLAQEEGNQLSILRFLELAAFQNLGLRNREEALFKTQNIWEKSIEYNMIPFQFSALILRSLIHYHNHQSEEIRETADLVQRKLKEFNLEDTRYIRINIFLNGLAELSDKNHEKAVKLLKQAWKLKDGQNEWFENHIIFLYYLGLAQTRFGNFEDARQSFEAALDLTAGKIFYGDLWTKCHLKLGEVYSKLGNTPKAVEHTQKFLDIWKDADPGLPEIEESRNLLSELKKF